MQKVKLTNRSKSPLGIPGCPMLEAGQSIFVENFEEVSQNRIVAKWLDRGFLEVGGDDAEEVEQQEETAEESGTDTGEGGQAEEPEADSETGDDESGDDSEGETDETGNEESETADEDQSDEDAEKEKLIIELRNHGINRDKRTSLQKLRDLLEEAQAE